MKRTETTEALITDGNFTLEKDVGIFENFLSADECDHFVELFDNKEKNGFVVNRQDSEDAELSSKKDKSFFVNIYEGFNGKVRDRNKSFVENFWSNGFSEYVKSYPTLSQRTCDLVGFKLQKTLPGEGYHIWHDEHQSLHKSSRLVTYIIYLNDDYTGGETEFISKSMRIQPKKGTLALFPCNYTHAHRGNPPLTGEKYILTGWVHNIS